MPEPGKIICLGLNYFDHAKEGGRDKPDYPWFFYRGKSSLLAHGRAGCVPKVSSKFDYEAELAVVIGTRVPRRMSQRRCAAARVRLQLLQRHVGARLPEAHRSVDDRQELRRHRWLRSECWSRPTSCRPARPGLHIQSRLERHGDAERKHRRHDLSQSLKPSCCWRECMTLDPGDVIVMGTPAGVGQARTPPVWMKAGDAIEIEVERIGTLRNPVENEAA